MSHTPGPWTFDDDWNRIPTIFGADGRQMVATVEKSRRQEGRYGFSEPLPERHANARLIAAAPEMLAALQSIMEDTVDLTPNFCADLTKDTRNLISAAIAKAIGNEK